MCFFVKKKKNTAFETTKLYSFVTLRKLTFLYIRASFCMGSAQLEQNLELAFAICMLF